MDGVSGRFSAPAPIGPGHGLDHFDCGVGALDDWLKRRARRNEIDGASRTFVTCLGRRVLGYYSLAAGSVLRDLATGKVRRNMPDPVPVLLIGRLAVDKSAQGRHIGTDLLRDAVLRIVGAAETVRARAILVHALSERAKSFYEHHGFDVSPVEPMMLMVTIENALATMR
jgi:GNAT superfamily N-acetyltransferase